MDLGLRGKTALVTGGCKGIGRGCSEVLAEEGCDIVMIYRSDTERSQQFAKKLAERTGVHTLALQGDAADPSMTDALFDQAIDALGPVDILINNAGGNTCICPFDEVTDAQWRYAQDQNLNSAFLMSRRFVRDCRTYKKGGHIVNVISKSALTTNSQNNTPYVSAKGGMMTMTRGLANEVTKDGIFVNGIVPGYVRTERGHLPGSERAKRVQPLLPTGEFATPRDMGVVAAFLCSPLAKQIIGAIVDCTGGLML